MMTEQEFFNLNMDFAILRELIQQNGLEKPICKKHATKWFYKCSGYATKNALYILALQDSNKVKMK